MNITIRASFHSKKSTHFFLFLLVLTEWKRKVGWHQKENIRRQYPEEENKIEKIKGLLLVPDNDNENDDNHHISNVHGQIMDHDHDISERKIGHSIIHNHYYDHDNQYYHQKKNIAISTKNIPITTVIHMFLFFVPMILFGIFVSWMIRKKINISKWKRGRRRITKGRIL